MTSGQLHIDWSPWGPGWLVAVVFAIVVVFLAILYVIDARRLSAARRWTLLAWRVSA